MNIVVFMSFGYCRTFSQALYLILISVKCWVFFQTQWLLTILNTNKKLSSVFGSRWNLTLLYIFCIIKLSYRGDKDKSKNRRKRYLEKHSWARQNTFVRWNSCTIFNSVLVNALKYSPGNLFFQFTTNLLFLYFYLMKCVL